MTTLACFAYDKNVPIGTDVSKLNNSENKEQAYRNRLFHAYMPLGKVSEIYKVSNYSSFENPTGIFFTKGEQITVTVSNLPADKKATLIINSFLKNGSHHTYPLKNGENKITSKDDGLGYIDYRADNPKATPPILVKFTGGVINGVFTRHDSSAIWRDLLNNAKTGILDCIGYRAQLAYDVDNLKKNNPDKGPELLELYDQIIGIQQKMMGWDREGIHPGNHLLCRVMWDGYMHADGWGAAFHFKALAGLCKPEQRGGWGVYHEVGHVNQVRPGFKWTGMTEVTNNLYSSWSEFTLNRHKDLRLEHESLGNADNEWMRGGRFDCYINNALVHKQLWQFYDNNARNKDYIRNAGKTVSGAAGGHGGTGDVFCTLCPLWQLQLYFAVAQSNENFYPNIFKAVRESNHRGVTMGEHRIQFFINACHSAKLNLTDFFLQLGMISPMNRMVSDYSPGMVTITGNMAVNAMKKVAHYPKPNTTVLYYITANSVDIYKNKLEVIKPNNFSPIISNARMEIPAGTWENAVAFEAYEGKKLIRISLLGLNHKDNKSTTVICPPNTTAVKAVQWDGKRYTVYEQE